MPSPLRISAKNLAALAMPDFCPRCFWIKAHCEHKLPYQIFPGIFSSIDNYTKRIVRSWFDRHGSAPAWLAGLGEIKAYREPPHYSKFKVIVEDASVELRGSPDAIFVRPDSSYTIADYKTARFSEYQDSLFPMYDAQLNAYAYIGKRCGFSPVTSLVLIYTEPVTDEGTAAKDSHTLPNGFRMDFATRILPVKIDPRMTSRLCRKARQVYDLDSPPRSRAGCEDCCVLEGLLKVASH